MLLQVVDHRNAAAIVEPALEGVARQAGSPLAGASHPLISDGVLAAEFRARLVRRGHALIGDEANDRSAGPQTDG